MAEQDDTAEESSDEIIPEESAADEKKSELPRRRIVMHSGEQSLEIEAPDSLADVARLAASLWLLTTPPRHVRIGFDAGGTLITELAGPYTEPGGAADPGEDVATRCTVCGGQEKRHAD